jgi:hypothetical protein
VWVLTSLRDDGRAVSFFGDLHPSSSGNVVEAMRSETVGYPVVSLKHYFRPGHRAIASIHSPMQCMMKEICAVPGAIWKPVLRQGWFSCSNQDQEMNRVAFPGPHRCLSQNGVLEKLNKLWIDRCLRHLGERPAMAEG